MDWGIGFRPPLWPLLAGCAAAGEIYCHGQTQLELYNTIILVPTGRNPTMVPVGDAL